MECKPKNRKRSHSSIDDISSEEIDSLLNIAEENVGITISDDIFQAVYEQAAFIWRQQFCSTWVPISRSMHNCNSRNCRMEQLLIEFRVHRSIRRAEHDIDWNKKRRFTESLPCQTNPNSIDKLIHVCVSVIRDGVKLPVQCGGQIIDHADVDRFCRAGNRTMVEKKNDSYVCVQTGHMHICRPDICKYRDTTEQSIRSGTMICGLTGNVLSDMVMVDKFWRPTGVVSSSGGGVLSSSEVVDGKRSMQSSADGGYNSSSLFTWKEVLEDIKDNLLTELCDIEEIRTYFNRRRPRRSSAADLAKEYYATALLRIASLFCKTRFNLDLEAAKEARRLANRSVIKALNSGNDFVNVVELRNIQKTELDNRKVPINILLSGSDRKNFFIIYAMRCLKLWLIIRTRTKLGREQPSLFPFIDFAITAMYIFRDGIKVPKTVTRGQFPEIILVPDPLLKLLLPRYEDIGNLDCDRNAIMTLRTKINRAIIESIRDDRTSPRDFYPDSISIETVSLSVYTPLRKHREKISRK